MQSVQPPRPVVVAAGWLAAALVATLAGLGGIRLVGDSLTGTRGGVVTEQDVARALAAATPTTAPFSPSPSVSPTSERPAGAVFSSAGGTVTVRCEAGDQAYLDSWSPAPGYLVRDYDRGPDDDVEVRFEGSDGRVELAFHCRDGVAQREQRNSGGHDDD